MKDSGQSLIIGSNIRINAQKFPKKAALIFNDVSFTFEEINRQANQLANWLQQAGFARGDKICIMAENCPEYVISAVALAKIGVAWVPVNYRFLDEEVAFIAADSKAKGFIVDQLRAAVVEKALGKVSAITARRCLVVGCEVPAGMTSFWDALLRGSSKEPVCHVEEDDLLYIGYTSGTTGTPKGAKITHRNRIINILLGAIHYNLGNSDRSIVLSPLYHTSPMLSALRSLYLGGTMVLLSKFDVRDTLEAIEKYQISVLLMVPTVLNRLKQLPEQEFNRYDLNSVKKLITGAAPLSDMTRAWVLEKLPHVNFFEFYGATECGTITILYPDEQRRKIRSVGRPVIGTELRVLDANRRELPPGETGEIFIRSLTAIDGYLNIPREESGCFEGEWITLQDLGKLDEEGYLYIVDRKKDMIKSGGVNIFPREIEETILKFPGVREVAIIGVPDDDWGESIKAIVVMRPGSQLSAQEIRDYCRSKISDFKVPRTVEFSNELPKAPTGKILKRVLRDEYWKGVERKV